MVHMSRDMIYSCGWDRKRTFTSSKVLSLNMSRRKENVRSTEYYQDSNRCKICDHGGLETVLREGAMKMLQPRWKRKPRSISHTTRIWLMNHASRFWDISVICPCLISRHLEKVPNILPVFRPRKLAYLFAFNKWVMPNYNRLGTICV